MNSYRDFSIKTKIGIHLSLILLLFTGYLAATWWFLQQPSHHGAQLQLFLLGSFGAALFIVALLFILINRHLISPLDRMETEIQAIARGDLDEPITVYDANDEIGTLSQSLCEMKDQLVSTVQQTKQFEQAVDHAGHGIYITDTDGTIEYTNSAFQQITKYDSDEVVGENPRILQSGYQSESYYEKLWDTILDGEVWEEEFINQRATGEFYHADQTIAPIFDGDGEISGFVAIMADRTEQRMLEQQTQVLGRVLRHNLRTECNLIDGYAQEITKSDDPEEQAEYGHRIRKHVEEMVDVGDKADRTVRELQHDNHRPSQGVCDTIEWVCESMKERYPEATITTELPAYEIDVLASIDVVLEEAIENAVEHNTQDSPEVTICVSLREERSERATQSPSVLIEIKDDGPGIPTQERSVIEKGKETPLFHGSGLGLWLIYWEITFAGGDITIRDRDPHGTCVAITLPRGSVSPFPRDTIDNESEVAVNGDRTDHDNTSQNND